MKTLCRLIVTKVSGWLSQFEKQVGNHGDDLDEYRNCKNRVWQTLDES